MFKKLIKLNLNNKIYKLNDKVEFKETIIHLGTKETINYGTIINIKNFFNPFRETKVLVYLADALIDGDYSYGPFLKEYLIEDLAKNIKQGN